MGNLDARDLPVESKDEIGILARSFRAMLEELREKAARFLSEEIGRELSDLGMPGAVFAVTFSKRPKERLLRR